MDRRLLVLAIGMFALGTDSHAVAGGLPEISRAFDVSVIVDQRWSKNP